MTYTEHNPSDHEDPLAGPSWLVSFIGVVLLVVIFLGLTSLYFGAAEEEEEAISFGVEPPDLEEIQLRQRSRLDPELSIEIMNRALPRVEVIEVDGREMDRRIVIPIEEAMEKVVAEYQ